MKILALDLGDKWVGLAISDPSRRHSFPLRTIEAAQLNNLLPKIVAEEQVCCIVYGLPFTLKGTIGSQLQKVENQIAAFKKCPVLQNLEWVGIDERFSSQGALHVLHQQNKKIGNNKTKEHAVVAALLLQSYLDAQSVGQQPP